MPKEQKRKPGRPRVLTDARRMGIFLDQATADKARLIGEGKVSEGIRKAVTAYRLRKNP